MNRRLIAATVLAAGLSMGGVATAATPSPSPSKSASFTPWSVVCFWQLAPGAGFDRPFAGAQTLLGCGPTRELPPCTATSVLVQADTYRIRSEADHELLDRLIAAGKLRGGVDQAIWVSSQHLTVAACAPTSSPSGTPTESLSPSESVPPLESPSSTPERPSVTPTAPGVTTAKPSPTPSVTSSATAVVVDVPTPPVKGPAKLAAKPLPKPVQRTLTATPVQLASTGATAGRNALLALGLLGAGVGLAFLGRRRVQR